MTTSTTAIDAWPLAARISGAIGSAPNNWQVVIGAVDREAEAAEALLVELESLYDGPTRHVAIRSVDDGLAAVGENRDDVLVLSLESRWDSNTWRALDMQRSRLMRDGMTILIVGRDDVAQMVTAAPNLWSWIGGTVWEIRIEEDED